MGKLSYSTAQVDEAIRKSISRGVAIVANDTDTPDTLTFSAGEVGTYKLLPLTLVNIVMNDFVVASNGIQYKGSATRVFAFNATAVVGTSAVNTTIHFRLALNGVTMPSTTGAIKLDSTTSLGTIDASSGQYINTDDTLKIYAMVDKACTISAYHTQLQLFEI